MEEQVGILVTGQDRAVEPEFLPSSFREKQRRLESKPEFRIKPSDLG